ncbi:MAG: polysaccharide biosynthesis C-terminal domain-containing protein [Lentisphaerae bacterium]|nr:polysaccharide biosynthesis C-terminal domain-containing protein [Lentisphaerota bacterium]
MVSENKTEGILSRLGEYAASSLAATFLRFPIRMLKTVLFVRLLGPAGMGVYRLFLTIPGLAVSVGNLGFGAGSIYLLAKQRRELHKVLGNALIFVAVQGIVIGALGFLYLAIRGGGGHVGEGIREYWPLLFAAAPLLLSQNVSLNLLMGIKSIHYMNFLEVGFSAFPMGFLLLFWWVTGDPVLSAIWSWIVTVVLVSMAAFLRSYHRAGRKLGFSWDYIREALSFGLRGNVSAIAGRMIRRIDVLFIAHFMGLEWVGYYAVSVALAELLLTVPSAIASPFIPLRFELETSEGKDFSVIIMKYVFAGMAVACLVAGLLAPWLITALYGSRFVVSVSAARWLLPGILALSIYHFLRADIFSRNRPGFVSCVAVGTMICNLVLNYLTIPRMGIAGAAISSSISYILMTTVLLLFFLRETRSRVVDVLLIRRRDAVLALEAVRAYVRKRKSGATGQVEGDAEE